MAEPFHVLVVDSSAVARMALEETLAHVPGVRVSLAGDGLVAQARVTIDPPDVVLLDLELPRLHGLDFLRWLMSTRPTPVVICSGAPRTSDAVMRALDAGAVAAIPKPSSAVGELARQVCTSVQAAFDARRKPSRPAPGSRPPPSRLRDIGASVAPARPIASPFVIVIGASTGGTEALAGLLPALPGDFPGIVIVQHMPGGFTHQFAERLDRLSTIRVREAVNGDVIEVGVALIAPGDRHAQVARRGGSFVLDVFDGPPASLHRPSIDMLFHSVAQVAGPLAVGLIMTGMGADGAAGLEAMRLAGARTLGQDEGSCTVYGMPRIAAERGAVELVASLDELPARLVEVAAALRGARLGRPSTLRP